MKIEAAKRLRAEADPATEQIKNQIETLQKQLPSKENTTTVDPKTQVRIRKQINDARGRLLDKKAEHLQDKPSNSDKD